MKIKELSREVARLLATQDGFTIDNQGDPLPQGYTVGGLKREDGDALAHYLQPSNKAELAALEAEIGKLLDTAADLLSNGAFIGGWRNGDTLALDLVTVTRGYKKAAQLAKEREQIAFGEIASYRYVNEHRIER